MYLLRKKIQIDGSQVQQQYTYRDMFMKVWCEIRNTTMTNNGDVIVAGISIRIGQFRGDDSLVRNEVVRSRVQNIQMRERRFR